MFVEKNYTTSDGLTVCYWIKKGSSQKPALFFVHGVGGNSTAWRGVIDKLMHLGHTMIKVDLRCHGKSDMPMKRIFYGIDKMSEDINGINEQEGIKKVIFLAHSFGGVCVLQNLIQGNNKAIAAVLCNAPHSNPSRYTSSRILRYSHPFLRMLCWAAATACFLRKKEYPYPDYYNLRDLSETSLWFYDISAAPIRVFFYNYLLIFNCNFSDEQLKSLKQPFLLFTSDKDPFLSMRSVYDLGSLVDTFKMVEIKGCDHETIMRKENEVAAETEAFLNHVIFQKKRKG